jgi:hypothetical protein
VLLPNVTPVVVRQYVWQQSGEAVMHYRRERTATSAAHLTMTTTEKDRLQ